MRKSLICKKWFCVLLAMLLLGGCQRRDVFLPEAENDAIFTVIGEE